jgi:hypothetical protein
MTAEKMFMTGAIVCVLAAYEWNNPFMLVIAMTLLVASRF